ncbi:MAG: hypothetical protein FH762_05720 [Firmicutes bacterium]|nr:hypothetical protein [Bacillota bacterium]
MGNNNITHKELLTFSNLTNLDWHFVDLKSKGDDEGKGGIKLNKLLTPESFARKDARGKIEKYQYMENVDVKKGEKITKEDRKEGLFKMRQHAGIAMEYLEKDEGVFLNNSVAMT